MMADLAFRQIGSSRSMHVTTDRLFLFAFKKVEQSEPVLKLISSLLCCVFAKDDEFKTSICFEPNLILMHKK
jgi:hypothetical protein